MKPPKHSKNPRLLTDGELRIMNPLWRLGEGTVRDVMAALPDERSPAYTTVSTMLRILEQKALVGSRGEGRRHIYFPLISKREYERRSVDHLLVRVFDGERSALVCRLLETEGLTETELDEIEQMLSRRRSDHG